MISKCQNSDDVLCRSNNDDVILAFMITTKIKYKINTKNKEVIGGYRLIERRDKLK